MAELGAGLEEAHRGRGRLFLLSGEPGVGKTRLAEEMADVATRHGARVLWGRAWESEGAPPYWPWIQILRALEAEADAGASPTQVHRAFPHLARIFPQRKGLEPETGDDAIDPSADPARQRFLLFDAVTRFVATATADRPHVFVLDDLQWADAPSLLLLRFLARELTTSRLMLLGTYRDVEARAEPQVGEIVSSLAREGRVLHLGGLSEADVGRLIAARDPRSSDELVSRMYRATEGNPFFVDGILRLLASESRPGRTETLPIPDEVRDAIRHRFAPLSEDLRELLSLAALLGREFDRGALVAVSGLTPEEVLSCLEEGRSLAVLVESYPGQRWRFTHDLYREVLGGDLSATARRELHERVGAALESFYGERAEEHAAELALHYFAAQPAGSVEKAIAYGTLAARRAMAACAWEDAVHELDRVRALLESDPSRDPERLDVLLELGRANAHSVDSSRFRPLLEEAASLARKLSLPQALARAALGLAFAAPSAGKVDHALVELIEEALSGLGESDRKLRGLLLAALARQVYHSPDREYRRRILEECVEAARCARDPRLLVEALGQRHHFLFGAPEYLPERIVVADEALDAARGAGAREVVLNAALPELLNLFETGDMVTLDTKLAAFVRAANEVRHPTFLFTGTVMQGVRALMSGSWGAAERLAAELSAAAKTLKETATTTFGAQQCMRLYEQGRVEEFLPSIRELVDQNPNVLAWRAVLASMCADVEQRREAQDQIDFLAAAGFEALPADYTYSGALVSLSLAVSILGEERHAGPIYERLLPFAGLNVFGIVNSYGAADRYLGLLATTLSRWDEAERHFDAAIEMHRRMGAKPYNVRTELDYASMLRLRGRPEDARRAESLLRSALEGSRDLGMARVLERAEEALAKIEAGPGDRAGAGTVRSNIARLRREGDFWTIGWKGRSFRLKDLRGLTYIHRLIGEAGREVHCLDLVGARSAVDLGDAGEVLDARAKAAYRGRLEDLREELTEAESNDDVGRSARARDEMEALAGELSAAVGLGGRDRRTGRNLERARLRVTRAIRDAVARVGDHDAALGQHLSSAIKTGAFCAYRPDPTSAISWES